MSNKSLVSNSSKTLLKNVIRHTDSHNKIIEENEMWRQWKTEQQGPEENNPSFLKGQCSDMRYEFPKRRNKRAYMDEEPQSTFWMKELYKTEEADENSQTDSECDPHSLGFAVIQTNEVKKTL
ncbi:uncharacterized protein NKAPD1-like isoform X3 [Mya arenaria]|uniref:uncharacterized protein NKAPD1-like isoform X3 n=1 Tax=Mya arenaria TaxID=6604 RepID=UPI0022E719BA|nr:uncharacterized protein NKAPD1-like isoform X3 [Mya arenaria]